jgi:FKBP-type peptidyl-prolyl cis-trans isomerase
MKYIVGLFIVFSVLLTSCSVGTVDDQSSKNETEIQSYIKQKNLTLQKTVDGLYYKVNTTGSTGKLKTLGDLVTFHYKMTLLDGSLIDSTDRKKNINRSMVWGLSNQSLFTLPLSLLKEGESGTFIIPSTLAFGGNTYEGIPPFSVILLELSLDFIRNETEQIELIQKTYNIQSPEKTSSGLLFKKLVDNPSGALVSSDAPVLVNYTGRLAFGFLKSDGAGGATYTPIFDSGTLGKPTAPFILSQSSLIPGFIEALKKMRVGEKAAVIIPYQLAYGKEGISSIPGYSPLYFEISIIAP